MHLTNIKAILLSATFLATSMTAVQTAQAQDGGRLNIGVKAGTQGFGAEATFAINRFIAMRVGANKFNFDYSGVEDEIAYDFSLKLKSLNVLVDLHPFRGNFRLTGGFVENRNTISALATTSGDLNIGLLTYTAAEVGTLTGDITFKKRAPYVGFGWGKALMDSGLSLNLDFGVMVQGIPQVKLNAVGGLISTNADLLAEIEREEANLANEIKSFKYYPTISLGISYTF